LDEFPEFPRHILEALRQPIEDGFVSIARAGGRLTFPAKCMLIAAQNPCPCGYLGDKSHECRCLQSHIVRYQKKISGPILDRIDIHLTVPAVKIEKLHTNTQDSQIIEASTHIRERVQHARNRQQKRFKNTPFTTNAEITSKAVKAFCLLSDECESLLQRAAAKMNLSARSYHRIIKLSQTIADLESSVDISPHHIAEALQYRPRTQFA